VGILKHQRIDRIAEEVKKEVSRIIREEVKDPRIGQMASVLRADVSGDLRHAKIYVSVLGDDKERASTMEGLSRALKIRYVPELSFILDTSIEYSVDISKKIMEVNRQQEKSNEND
jgi:ribosome-binding factor A